MDDEAAGDDTVGDNAIGDDVAALGDRASMFEVIGVEFGVTVVGAGLAGVEGFLISHELMTFFTTVCPGLTAAGFLFNDMSNAERDSGFLVAPVEGERMEEDEEGREEEEDRVGDDLVGSKLMEDETVEDEE